MGIYVFKKALLVKLLKEDYPSANDFGGEIIPLAAKDNAKCAPTLPSAPCMQPLRTLILMLASCVSRAVIKLVCNENVKCLTGCIVILAGVMAYLFNDYWEDIGTIKSFFEANLALTQQPPPLPVLRPPHPHLHLPPLPATSQGMPLNPARPP